MLTLRQIGGRLRGRSGNEPACGLGVGPHVLVIGKARRTRQHVEQFDMGGDAIMARKAVAE